MNVVGIVLLVLAGLFGVLTLLSSTLNREHTPASVAGGLVLAGILGVVGLLLVLL